MISLKGRTFRRGSNRPDSLVQIWEIVPDSKQHMRSPVTPKSCLPTMHSLHNFVHCTEGTHLCKRSQTCGLTSKFGKARSGTSNNKQDQITLPHSKSLPQLRSINMLLACCSQYGSLCQPHSRDATLQVVKSWRTHSSKLGRAMNLDE